MEYNVSWNLKYYLNQSLEGTCATYTTMDSETKIILCYSSLRVFSNTMTERIPLEPETYILHSTLRLGILSFEPGSHGKWILGFHDELSAVNCAQTLRNNGLKVIDIQKLLSKKKHMKNLIIKTLMNAEFSQFATNVEKSIKNKCT